MKPHWRHLLLAGALFGSSIRLLAEDPTPPAEEKTAVPAGPPPSVADLADLFRTFRTDTAALSPDGEYLAFSLREEGEVSVVILNVEHPETAMAKVVVGTDESSTPMLGEQREKTPAAIRWLGWVTSTRLLVDTNRVFTFSGAGEHDSWTVLRGAVLGVDADGKNGRVLVTPRDVAEDGFAIPPPERHTGVVTPDVPTDSNGQPKYSEMPRSTTDGDPDTRVVPLPAEAAESPETAPPTHGTATPREFHVLDFAADDDRSVLIAARGSRGHDVYRLNAVTGDLERVSQEIYEREMLPLLDRTGRARIAMRTSTRTSFPHLFLYDVAKAFRRWTPLDEVFKEATGGGFSVSPDNFFGRRAIPLGFDGDPDVLYYASNLRRERFGIYSVNVKTGRAMERALEHPQADLVGPGPEGSAPANTLVFDRYRHVLAGVRYQDAMATTLWVRPEFEKLQRRLDATFPNRAVRIVGWDRQERRFLLLARGPNDAGAYSLFDSKSGKLIEFARRAPWQAPGKTSNAAPFSFASVHGTRLGGLLMLPRVVRMTPVPVAILFPEDPWERVSSEYQPEAEALASLGLAVLQVEGRGTWGGGLAQRAVPQEGIEQAQAKDALEVLDTLAKKFPLSLKRVAVMGRGRGAYVALRAAQLHPERFRCAMGLEPTLDVGGWIEDARWKWKSAGLLTEGIWGGPEGVKRASIFAHREPLTSPVLLLAYPGPRGGQRTFDYLSAKQLEQRLTSAGTPVVLGDLDDDYVQGLPAARARAFRKIEEFINLYLYEYTVKVGETKALKN
ncbi:hypothetical protein DB347_09230 [Opitutaceae bacterium EW11]|nr:hypothetical protein DB347_09230 [Opitutaceae bacterium EW11]